MTKTKTPAAADKAEAPSKALAEVTLIAPHKHGGKERAKGEKINVSARRMAWLIAHKKVAG